MLTGAQLMCRVLLEEGVDVMFGYPGGAIMPFYHALPEFPGLRHILVRHEQAAAHAADGYARASGRAGVCVATSGPGATNLVTGLATAYMDNSPVVAITGQVSRPMMGRDAMMRPFGMGHFCGPNGGRMGEFMIGRVERVTQPTGEQRPGFDKLKEAITKAGETMRGACTTERPVTPTGRLAAAEKRLAAMLDAVRTVRPALDAYYNSLTDEQKARLTLAQAGKDWGDASEEE